MPAARDGRRTEAERAIAAPTIIEDYRGRPPHRLAGRIFGCAQARSESEAADGHRRTGAPPDRGGLGQIGRASPDVYTPRAAGLAAIVGDRRRLPGGRGPGSVGRARANARGYQAKKSSGPIKAAAGCNNLGQIAHQENQRHTATIAGRTTAAASSAVKAAIAQSTWRQRSHRGRPRRSAALSRSRLFDPR